jgi:tetratricopeptide (TPR) repeat protein/TolB-like protein
MTTMASLIPGYEYDIFISYRQKDNKHDGWVTEFVNNLKGELESTFKEEISVYFDINPHDGLLETHDVDASLKEKLKCLVFIPIISRTYCDPKSFAWEHEFKAFVEQASQDQFGLKVKLPNGNVSNRVLPIRIHDLDSDDIRFCEFILDGVLRGVEFIYKEPGVNRPLTPYDDENKNLNKTRYRNQINKVALAINELIQGLKTEPEWRKFEKRIRQESFRKPEETRENERKKERLIPVKSNQRRVLQDTLILIVLVVAAIIAFPKLFKRDTLEKLRSSGEKISVVVMPFQNMTNDTTWNVWQDGIQNELITSLTNSEELKVRQTETINNLIQRKGFTNYASITTPVASTLSQKLDANIFIIGTIKQAGSTIRLNAQLVDSKTEEVFKSFQIDGIPENVLHCIDSLSGMVKNYLVISELGKEMTPGIEHFVSTNSTEAYRYFISGENALYKQDYNTAVNLYLQAISKDSNFVYAIIRLSTAYSGLGAFGESKYFYDQAKKWCLKAYERRDHMSMHQKILTNRSYALRFETPIEVINYTIQLLESDDQSPLLHFYLGNSYISLYQYEKAVPELEKALEIYNIWDLKPPGAGYYTNLGLAYDKVGKLTKEKKLYKKAEKDFPDNSVIIWRKAILAFTNRDTIAANGYIEKLKTHYKESLYPEADILTYLAYLYVDAGSSLDKAEGYFRLALSLEPERPERMNNLAWFLVDNDRNIVEGLELVDKALELSPENHYFLDCKGWGLYKRGKYEEALEVLNKSWELRPVYRHAVYLHLEAAKKAVASQKNN